MVQLSVKAFGHGLLILMIAAGLSACTAKTNQSSVKLALPNAATMQAAALSQVGSMATPIATGGAETIISINADGKVVYSWQRRKDSDEAPTGASFQINKGALIQAMIVIEGGGTTQFYYADSQTLSSAPDSLNLDMTLTNVAASQNLVEGNIVGRYLTGPNVGPTGTFNYMFTPASAPPMIVTSGEVFSGWMNTFGLSSSLISYAWSDGTPAFAVNTQDSSAVTAGATKQRAARIEVPAGFENDSNGGGGYSMSARPAKLVTVGFFGPYADAAFASSPIKLCYATPSTTSSAPLIQGLYASANLGDASAAPSNQMVWIGQLDRDAGATNQVRVTLPKGGDDSGSCGTTGLLYKDFLKLDPTQLKSTDSILGFRGPYAANAAGNLLTATPNVSTATIDVSWTYLPGAASGLAGSSLFYRVLPAGSSSSDEALRAKDGYRCADFHSNQNVDGPAFSEISVGTGTTTASISASGLTPAMISRLQVVVCPRAVDGHYFSAGLSNSNGGGNSSGPATQFTVTNLAQASGSVALESSTCIPLLVRTTDSNGGLANPTSTRTWSISTDDPSEESFYIDATCSTPALGSNPLTGLSMWNQQIVYLKSNRASLGTPGFIRAYDQSSTPLADGTRAATFLGIAVTATQLVPYAPNPILAYQCVPVTYAILDASGNAARAPTGMSGGSYWTLPSVTGLTFFNNSSCSSDGAEGYFVKTTVSVTSAMAGQTATTLWASYVGTANTVSIGSSGTNSGIVGQTISVNVNQPGAATQIAVSTASAFPVQTCQRVQINLDDSNGNPAPAPTPVPVVLAPAVGGYFADKLSCDGALSDTSGSLSSVTIPAGSPNVAVYYRDDGTPGTVALGISSSSYPTASFSVSSVSTTLAVPYRVVIAFPGEFVDTSTYNKIGTPWAMAIGQVYDIMIYPLTEVGKVIANYSGGPSGLGVSGAPMGMVTNAWIPLPNGIDLQAQAVSEVAGVNFSFGGSIGQPYAYSNPYAIGYGQANVFAMQPMPQLNGVCEPILVGPGISQMTGTVLTSSPVPSGVSFNLNASAGVSYFSDATCSTTPASSVVVMYPASAALVYAKLAGTPTSTYTPGVSASGGFAANSAPTAAFGTSAAAGIAYAAGVIGPTHFTVEGCSAYAAILTDSAGLPSIATSPAVITPYATGSTNVYTDSSCTNAVPGTLTIPSGQSSAIFYVHSISADSGTLGATYNSHAFGTINFVSTY